MARTENYDHCNFTVSPHAFGQARMKLVQQFVEILLKMKWEDSKVRPLLELEGLKAWLPGRVNGYRLLTDAVDHEKFYDQQGQIIAENYRY
jgi:hypothetical protein